MGTYTHRHAMHIDEHRRRIQTAALIKRLHDHIFHAVKMSKTQVAACNILLKKCLPDLQTVVLQGSEAGGPVRMSIEQQREEARKAIEEAFAEPVLLTAKEYHEVGS